MTLARKERVAIFWMATKRFEVENMPGLYALASSAPLHHLLGEHYESICEANGFGYAALRSHWHVERVSGEEAADDLDQLFQGLIKLKEKAGLYQKQEGVVRLEHNELFYHKFRIPDSVTVGSQTVTAYAIKDQRIIARGSVTFPVDRAGAVAWLVRLSSEYSVLYGVIAVLVAAGAGLTASRIFGGRGGH
jgi:uncharacterized protein (TIGR02186 family)